MEIVLFGVVIILMAVLHETRAANRKRAGLCEVCSQKKPLCDQCGRCLDSSCNGGCIYCRGDLPFGRRLRK